MADENTNRKLTTATIASGSSVSGAIDLLSSMITGLISPTSWTTAGLTIEVSVDGTTWEDTVYDSYGTQVNYLSTFLASAAYSVDVLNMMSYRFIRLRSGTVASPVNQAANRVFTLITRPFN